MIDIGWTEMLTIAVLTVIVVGPRDLPKVMRGLARIMAKMRGLAREFQSGMDELAREAEFDEIRKNVDAVSKPNLAATAQKFVDPDNEYSIAGGVLDAPPPVESDGQGDLPRAAEESGAKPPPDSGD